LFSRISGSDPAALGSRAFSPRRPILIVCSAAGSYCAWHAALAAMGSSSGCSKSQKSANVMRIFASDIPRLWSASPLGSADHKQIVRQLIERVVVEVRDKSEVVTATIHWQGGLESRHDLVRSVARYDSLLDFDRLWERIERLWRSGLSLDDPESCNMFHPGPDKPLLATPAAITMYSH
jgi:hypothetical protein